MKYILRQKYSALGAPGGVTKVGSPNFIRCYHPFFFNYRRYISRNHLQSLNFLKNKFALFHKLLTFWIFIISKNVNMNLDVKMSNSDVSEKLFEFQPILPFFVKKL